MDALAYILGLALTGILVGALARLAVPGPDPMSIFETMLVGVAGTLVAGLITYYLFDRNAGPGLLLSILCAIGIVFAVRKLRERQLGPGVGRPEARSPFGGGNVHTQVHFFPGCLVFSLIASIVLTVLLNLIIRAF